jgi:membrane protein
VWRKFSAEDVTGLAAEMSYYFVLSMFPFLMVLAALVGTLPFTGVWASVLKWITLYFPQGAQRTVFQIVLGLTQGRTGFLSLGILATIWSASTGLMSLIDALDRMYEVKETRGYLKRLGLAIVMLFVLAILVLSTFGLLTAGGRMDRWLVAHSLGLFNRPHLWRFVRWITSVVVLGIGIAIIDRTMPNLHRPWRWTVPGVVFILSGWLLSTAGFNLYAHYVGTFNKTYGILGVFVLLMIWIYLLSIVVLMGAAINSELNKLRVRKGSGFRTGIAPKPSPAY